MPSVDQGTRTRTEAPRRVVAPNRWLGEPDALVGPFASREVAERFVGATVEFGQPERAPFALVRKGERWYLGSDEA
jgi:hypothetical protein